MSDDLEILHGNNSGRPAQIAYANAPHVLRGSAKLATRFANLFLSDVDATTGRGTGFVAKMRAGTLRTDAAVILAFTAAAFDVLQQLGDQSALPASEQVAKAELIDHSLFDDHLSLTVQLTTGDGATNFVLPLARV